MRIGIGRGPGDAPRHHSTHYIYDVRSGAVVAVHHFAGAAPKSERDRVTEMLRTSHEASGIALEHLAVLSNPDIPAGDGELQVDHARQQIVLRPSRRDLRLRP